MRGNVRLTVDSEVTVRELRLSIPACTRNNGQSITEVVLRVKVIFVMFRVDGITDPFSAERTKIAVGWPPVESIAETDLVIRDVLLLGIIE